MLFQSLVQSFNKSLNSTSSNASIKSSYFFNNSHENTNILTATEIGTGAAAQAKGLIFGQQGIWSV